MQYTVLLALVAAAAVSATDYHSKTYGKSLPPHKHYDCDATDDKCYAPKSYGSEYKPNDYSYHYEFPYPGPKERFCAKLKKIGGFFKGVVKKVFAHFKHTWVHFKTKWHTWCAKKQSDWDRFEHWKKCKADEFKDWWGYYHDLCKTRKALWDDAMREFHRQWCHYKQTRKEEYKAHKKACGYEKKVDYDEKPKYHEKINKYGVTPIEDHYHGYKAKNKYKPDEYKKHCAERDSKYKGKDDNDKGHYPDKNGPQPPSGGGGNPGPPEPVGGDVAPVITPVVTPTGPPAPVSG
jgi:hypothetical protein